MSDDLPTTINVSKNAYRMFTSMCKRTSHDDDNQQEKEKVVKDSREKPFSILPQAFLVAVAIGIIHDKKLKPSDSAQLIRGESLRRDKSYEPFKQLIKSKYDAKNDSDVANLMAQFAEYGVTELYNEFHKTGTLDFIRLSKMGSPNSA